MARADHLFTEVHYFAVREGVPNSIRQEVAQFTDSYLLGTSPEELIDYLLDKYTIVHPTLLVDQISIDEPREVDIQLRSDDDYGFGRRSGPVVRRGTRIAIYIPFRGTSYAFKIQPSTSTSTPPRAQSRDEELLFVVEGVDLTTEGVNAQLTQFLRSTGEYLGWLKTNLDELNGSLRRVAEEAITKRREKLLKDQSLAGGLGFKIRTRTDAPTTYVAPTVRRKIGPQPPATRAASGLDPTLDQKEYERILQIISSMVHVLERSPSSFTGMDEETLRSHLLVQLNGQYEGGATGETFNANGKTDILIRVGDRNIFIAECKIWSGQKGLGEAVDQVLSYSTWRDTKVAIVLFVRNKEFTKVLESIPTTMRGHKLFKRELPHEGGTQFKYVFSSAVDPDRELILTVLAFHTPNG